MPPSGPMDDLSLPAGEPRGRQPRRRAGSRMHAAGPAPRSPTPRVVCVTGADSRGHGRRRAGRPCGSRSRSPPGRCSTSARRRHRPAHLRRRARRPGRARCTSAARRRSRSAASAATAVAPLAPATCCAPRDDRGPDPRRAAHRPRPTRAPEFTHDLGARGHRGTARRRPTSSPRDDIDAVLRRPTWTVHCNSDRTGVRLDGPKPPGRGADGGDAGLHPSNIHDNAYASAPSTSPATPRSCSAPTVRASAASSAPSPSSPAAIAGSSARSAGRHACGSCRSATPVRRACAPPDAFAPRIVRRRRRRRRPTAASSAATATVLAPARGRRTAAAATTTSSSSTATDGARPRAAHARPRARSRLDRGDGPPGHHRHHARHPLAADPLRPDVLRASTAARTCCRTSRTSCPRRTTSWCRVAHRPAAALLGRPGDSRRDRAVLARRPRRRAVDAVEHRVHPPDQRSGVASTRSATPSSTPSTWCSGSATSTSGAPVATPLDPRHRLVTTKYNPARTWTAANAVGIGGKYLCIYGMESPGRLPVRRAAPCRSGPATGSTGPFERGHPWLFRFFDRIVWEPVSRRGAARATAPRSTPGAVRRRRSPTARSLSPTTCVPRATTPSRSPSSDAAAVRGLRGREVRVARGRRVRPRRRRARRGVGRGRRSQVPAGASVVEAPMVGSVWRVEVDAGRRGRGRDDRCWCSRR